jgi:hypothetical protein
MTDNKGIKTIVLSELPKHEKVKYFQFLLDNEINFTKDDQGNYIALVKVLNPQFYNDVDLQQEKMKEDNLSKLSKQLKQDNQVQEVSVNSKQLKNNVDLRLQSQKLNYTKVSSSNQPNIKMVNNQLNLTKPQLKKDVGLYLL